MNEARKGLFVLEFPTLAAAATLLFKPLAPDRPYWIFAGMSLCGAVIFFAPVLQRIAAVMSLLFWTSVTFFFAGGFSGIHTGASVLAAAIVFAFMAYNTWRPE